VKKGAALTEADVTVKRPGSGIPAKSLDAVIGKKAKEDLPKDAILKWDDLEG
jgi:N-acetylneuraminate synthase